MPVFLEVRSGPRKGSKIRVDPARLFRVGRTAQADLSFDGDSHMSGVHFSLGFEANGCRLSDLNSRNGTLVNGQAVNTALVAAGDTIVAGETAFVLLIEADEAVAGFAAGVSPAATPAEIQQARLLTLLRADSQPLFAILDAARDIRILALLLHHKEECQSLYEGVEGAQLAQVAPYLVRLGKDSRLLEALVKEGWGKSWGVYLTSSGELMEVRRHLRHFLQVKLPDGEQVYFRFYDPRVMRVFLPSCTAEETTQFFGPIKRYVMESEESDKLWEFTTMGRSAVKKVVPLLPAAGQDVKAMSSGARLERTTLNENSTAERPSEN